MIKALQVISGNDYGGGGVHVLNTIKASKGIFDNNLLLIGQGPLADKCKRENIPFKLVENKIMNSELINYINDNKFDIVNFHGARSVLVHMINKNRIKSAAVVTVHSDFNKDFLTGGIKKLISTQILKKSLKSFNNHIGVSEFIKDLLIRDKIAHNAYIVPNAVELNKLKVTIGCSEIRKKLNIDEKDYVYSIVARLHPIKNHKNLILAFKKLSYNYKNVRLLIIGDGALEEELKSLVQELGLRDKVNFLGYIDNPANYINASDISMITSFSEGGIPPLAILESLAIGVPCISTKLNGLKEIFKDNLIYINPDSAEDIFQKMKYSYENKENMKNIVKAGQSVAINEFSLENFAENYLNIYRKVLNR